MSFLRRTGPPFARKWLAERAQARSRSVIFQDDLPSSWKEMARGTCPNEVEKCHFSGGRTEKYPKVCRRSFILRKIRLFCCTGMTADTCSTMPWKCQFCGERDLLLRGNGMWSVPHILAVYKFPQVSGVWGRKRAALCRAAFSCIYIYI